jgi:hypothetical protein
LRGSAVTLAWLAVGVALLAAFVLVQRLVAHPLLPLRVVLDRNRAGAYAAIGLTFIAVFALFFFLTSIFRASAGTPRSRPGWRSSRSPSHRGGLLGHLHLLLYPASGRGV